MAKKREEKERPGEKIIPANIEFVQAQCPTLYINNAQFGTTEWDIHMDLSEIKDANVETKTLYVIPRIKIVMSIPFAIKFAAVMQKTLDSFTQAMRETTEQLERRDKEPQSSPSHRGAIGSPPRPTKP